MRSEAFASPNQEEKRPGKTGPRVVPIDAPIADAMRDFNTESPDESGGLFPSEGLEPIKVAAFPAEHAPQKQVTPVIEQAPTASKPRNWRTAVVAVLGVVVLAQGGLMAYWAFVRGDFSFALQQDGSVTVTSEPAGAPVAIDGAVRGQTPLTISLATGAHSVLVGTGAQARSQSVNVTRGGAASMHVQLPIAVAAAVPTGTAALQIATEPSGARVWVDGELRGVAPLTISNLKAGDHPVTVRSGTGDPINRTVTVQEGATASLLITMPGAGSFASGWLAITSPVVLQVLEKGALLGTTEMPRIMLPAGAHELELVNATLGYRLTRSFTIGAGQTANFTAVLPRGTLSVNALPWAEVWIDGQRVGETPIGNYSIPIGVHELLFRHPELGEQRRTVTVGAQGPVRVGVDMKKP